MDHNHHNQTLLEMVYLALGSCKMFLSYNSVLNTTRDTEIFLFYLFVCKIHMIAYTVECCCDHAVAGVMLS